MMKTRRLKILALTVLFIVPLMLVASNAVFCGPNPSVPGGMRLSGPAVTGEISIYPATGAQCDAIHWSPCVLVKFSGNCKGADVSLEGPTGEPLPLPADVTYDVLAGNAEPDPPYENMEPEEFLEDWILTIPPIPACDPSNQQVIVNTIVKFSPIDDDGDGYNEKIIAKVVMLYVVPTINPND